MAEHIRAAGFQRLCLPVLPYVVRSSRSAPYQCYKLLCSLLIKFLFFVLFVLLLILGDSQMHSYVATLPCACRDGPAGGPLACVGCTSTTPDSPYWNARALARAFWSRAVIVAFAPRVVSMTFAKEHGTRGPSPNLVS